MKKHFILILVLCLKLTAQAQTLEDSLLRNDAFFTESNYNDEKWENESAIILAQKTVLVIEKKKNEFEERWVTRTKILLQDKAAVEYWSDFTTSQHDFFEMKIVKRNGTVVQIDTNQFIPVSEGFALSSFDIEQSNDIVRYKKLALENLAVGDVIDYTYQTININNAKAHTTYLPLRKVNTWNNFISYNYAFGSNYPKVKQSLILRLDPTLYFTVRAINGLPQPTEKTLDNGLKELAINVRDIERLSDGYFTNSEVTNPKVKIEIAYAKPYRYYRTPLILGKQGENSASLNIESLKRALFMDFHKKSYESILGLNTNEKDATKALNDLYTKYQKLVYEKESADYSQGSYFTAFNLYHTLSKKFDTDILVCLPRTNGSLENLAITTDIIFAVRVKTDDGTYHYAYNFYKYTAIDDWDSRIVGTKAYAFKPTKKFKNFELREVEVPDYQSRDNLFYVKSEISLDLEAGLSNFSANTKLKGELRSNYADDIINIGEFGYELYYVQTEEKLDRFYNRLVEKGEANRLKRMKDWLEDDFNVIEYKNFELKTTGFESDNNILEYNEQYVVDDLFRNAGVGESQYYVIDVGRVITSQIALLEKDKERTEDIVVDFKKCFHYDIYLDIPSGYRVENISALVKDVETKAGTFKSSVLVKEEEGKTVLEIKSIKSYTNTYLPKDEWNEMVRFLDAAYNFSQQKVVLVKDVN